MTPYLIELKAACDAFGLEQDGAPWMPVEGTEDQLAFVDARLTVPGRPDALLKLAEEVDMSAGEDPRKKYSYRLVFRRQPVLGYDRDPYRHPEVPDHSHDYAADPTRKTRIPARRTAREFLKEAMDYLDAHDLELTPLPHRFPKSPGL